MVTRGLFCAADPPSSIAGRTLTLVAKSVQNLANLVEFGAKVEPAFHPNPLIGFPNAQSYNNQQSITALKDNDLFS